MWRGEGRKRASRGRNVGDGRGRSAASARARGIPMTSRAADSTRTSLEASRSSREAASADETCRALLGTFGGSPNGDKTRAGGSRWYNLWPEARRARAGSHRDLRSRHREGARSPRSLLAAHHGLHRALVSPAERAKTAPAFPAPAPNWFPGAEGIPLRGRKALFRKRGAVLGAREPHVVGRFDGSQTLDRRKPRRRRDDNSGRTAPAKKLRVMIPGEFLKNNFTAVDRVAGRVASPPRGALVPLPPLPIPLPSPLPPLPSPSLPFPLLPFPLIKNVFTRCNWARVPSRWRRSPTVPR